MTATCGANSKADKGLQSQIPPKLILDEVLRSICLDLQVYIGHPHKRGYDASQVDWWFSHLDYGGVKETITKAFNSAHENVRIVSLLSTGRILRQHPVQSSFL
jgi:hypothetical protein